MRATRRSIAVGGLLLALAIPAVAIASGPDANGVVPGQPVPPVQPDPAADVPQPVGPVNPPPVTKERFAAQPPNPHPDRKGKPTQVAGPEETAAGVDGADRKGGRKDVGGVDGSDKPGGRED